MPVPAIPQPTAPPGSTSIAKFRRPQPPTFASPEEEQRFAKGALAGACRIFASQGWENSSAQLSIRDPVRPDTIWTNAFGALSCVSVSGLLQIDSKGEIVSGPVGDHVQYDIDAVFLHLAIYTARPDLGALIHAHTPFARTWSMQARELDMICQDSCTFFQRNKVLPLGLALNVRSNSKAIQDVLGAEGKMLILAHKGLLTAGASMECALSYFIRGENLCRAQLLAEAASRGRGTSGPVKIGDEEVAFTYNNTGSEHHAWLMAIPYFAKLTARGDGSHLL